jgi:hypothetical protein
MIKDQFLFHGNNFTPTDFKRRAMGSIPPIARPNAHEHPRCVYSPPRMKTSHPLHPLLGGESRGEGGNFHGKNHFLQCRNKGRRTAEPEFFSAFA